MENNKPVQQVEELPTVYATPGKYLLGLLDNTLIVAVQQLKNIVSDGNISPSDRVKAAEVIVRTGRYLEARRKFESGLDEETLY